MDGTTSQLPVVVIGAGPVGLAAAAHLLERGLEPLVLEAGEEVGAAVRAWGHVRLFSPWEYDVDAAAVRLLETQGWESPDRDALPTGADLVDSYLAPLAATPQLAGRIRTGTRVRAVSRQGVDKTRTVGREGRPYLVRTVREGRVEDALARAVLDASGTWGRPNPLGAAGLPAVGEEQAGAWLTGPLPDVLGGDRARFAGRHTLVVGMGHSAATTLLALVRLREEEPGTEVTWAIRGRSPARLYGGGDADGLPARGLLGSSLRAAVADGAVTLLREVTIGALAPAPGGRLAVAGTGRDGAAVDLLVDSLVGATGSRPDLDVLREVRLDLDPGLEAPAALAPLIDPDFHSCGTVPPHGAEVLAHPDEGLYVVGMKSYGRAPTFLLATGYEQVRSVAAALAGDAEAAARVELALPGTGVCSTDLGDREAAEAASCGTGVGFATGSEHGRSAEAPAPVPVTSSVGG
ncbi:FAD-dependent oxidoreductase [Geodermatophilus normandii]|uniref:NAD(P)-binding domain-containing protein n=1 Tax=Geodermatophilus normandii TaxID=1137989 RepID=A0A6P0GF26_9ACTN|nr:FAD-dependent oxidoreductase [Geodermatophilus normandii]NEM05858.1 NAD(P)-binding domain-containing protein [Geodermatophilus normandii]